MTDAQAERDYWDRATTNEELLGASVHGGDMRVVEYLDQIDEGMTILPNARVLDLGCGPGRFLCPYADRWIDMELVGVDSSPDMVKIARKRCGNHNGNVTVVLNDGRTLPFPDDHFDAAFCVLVFQHIPEDAVRGYLAEVARVLRYGGMFRFQYVEGENDALYAHDYDPKLMHHWCEVVGLAVQSVDYGRLEDSWVWVTAAKRGRT